MTSSMSLGQAMRQGFDVPAQDERVGAGTMLFWDDKAFFGCHVAFGYAQKRTVLEPGGLILERCAIFAKTVFEHAEVLSEQAFFGKMMLSHHLHSVASGIFLPPGQEGKSVLNGQAVDDAAIEMRGFLGGDHQIIGQKVLMEESGGARRQEREPLVAATSEIPFIRRHARGPEQGDFVRLCVAELCGGGINQIARGRQHGR